MSRKLCDVRATCSALVIALALAIVLGAALGCSPSERTMESEVRYEPPTEHRIVVETVVDLPFDAAWAELIRRLSESSFRVSTLEKASRLVRVDLNRSTDLAAAANKPARYVDCGRTVRTLTETGEEARVETFEYIVAEPSHYRESDKAEGGYRVSDVNRRVDMEASATLYLQPEGERRTRVSVKSRYVVRVQITGTARILPSDPDDAAGVPTKIGPRTESIRFSTFQPGQDQRSGGLTCRATGDFEHALVAIANPAAAI